MQLRGQPLQPPAPVVFDGIKEAIVKPVFSVLPELKTLWQEAETSPGIGHRHFNVGVRLRQVGDALLELAAAADHLALW